MKTREDLLRQIADERAEWNALVDSIDEHRLEEPGPMGEWTFKDLAAHLLGWNERQVDEIEAGPGVDPPTPWPSTLQNDDAINAWIYEQHHDRPAGDVLSDLDRSYERLANAIANVADDDLLTPGRFDFMGGQRALVEADFFSHYRDDHAPDVRAWLGE
jgi:hypothetical protein